MTYLVFLPSDARLPPDAQEVVVSVPGDARMSPPRTLSTVAGR